MHVCVCLYPSMVALLRVAAVPCVLNRVARALVAQGVTVHRGRAKPVGAEEGEEGRETEGGGGEDRDAEGGEAPRLASFSF